MGQTVRAFAYVLVSAVAMAAAVELVRHFEDRIGNAADAAADAGERLWSRAVNEQRMEAEVRHALPWVLWEAHISTLDAAEGHA